MTALGLVLKPNSLSPFPPQAQLPRRPSLQGSWPPQSVLSSGSFSSTPRLQLWKCYCKDNSLNPEIKYSFPSFNLTASLTVFPALPQPSRPHPEPPPSLSSHSPTPSGDRRIICLQFPGTLSQHSDSEPNSEIFPSWPGSWRQMREGRACAFQEPAWPLAPGCSVLGRAHPSLSRGSCLLFYSASTPPSGCSAPCTGLLVMIQPSHPAPCLREDF